MRPVGLRLLVLALTFGCGLSAQGASAATCQSGSFEQWIEGFKREAAGQGVTARGLAALDGVTYDANVVARDRKQGVFKQSFEQFSGRMVPPRMTRASNMMKRHGSLLSRIEEQYGVPGAVLVAIWGLETDFGAVTGDFGTIRALASLAYDCRRSEKFQAELLDALRIVERGDMTAADMRGAWAGEIGQTQFMPSSWIKYAVDFDGNGRRDLLHNVPDVLASTANYLKSYGWQKGKDYQPGAPNFAVIQQWNKSEVYAKTVANFASQLARAP
jgi:lytic murein transglycosylase